MATKLTDPASIDLLISEMTVAEKARLVIGGSPWCTEELPEYGIPKLFMLDSCNGLNLMEYESEFVYRDLEKQATAAGTPLDREKNGYMGGLLLALGALHKKAAEQKAAGVPEKEKPYGIYPPGIAYGSTWDPELVKKTSAVMAREMASYGIDMVLGPNINIHRDPRCGRLAESISEDPYLVSKIAVAQVEGIQSTGMIACVKHFAANNQEKDRLGVAEHVPERALREIYLPGFKACVDAGVGSVMSAYNMLNGKPSAMNDTLLTDILRKEWGFEGFVVSDWGASYEQIPALAAGTDLTMPGLRGIRCIEQAVEAGTLPMKKLDASVRRILTAVLHSFAMTGKRSAFRLDEACTAAEEAARAGMILLKNDGTLPLALPTDVVFVGKRSQHFASCSAGSSKVESDLVTAPYSRAVELLGEEYVALGSPRPQTRCWIAVVGADGHEGSDREDLAIDPDDQAALERAIKEAKAANGKVVVVVNATGPADLTAWEADVNAILCPFFAGMMGGKAATDAVFGQYNPSGKLPVTWPKRCQDVPAYKNYPGENKEVWYGEGMYVGYRWYDMRGIEPAYPFGYGLSYTQFALSELCVPETVNVDTNTLQISLKVKNIGTRTGSEVVQVYVHDVRSKLDKPEKQLKGFCKVHLEPQQEKTVTMELCKEDLAGYSVELRQWVTEPGEFELLVGTSCQELPLRASVRVRCKNPYGYSDRTAVGAVAADPRALDAVNSIIGGDLRIIAKVALEYGPDTPFGQVWNGAAMGKFFADKGVRAEEIADLRLRLQAALDEIEIE